MTTEILQYAGGTGANVLSQPDYAALTSTLSNGMSSGIVQSALFNKILRQASFMAAGLAKAMSDMGANVLDDGNLATLAANLEGLLCGRPGHAFTTNDWTIEGGLIRQWGYAATGTGAAGNMLITLPRAFPNSMLWSNAVSANGSGTPTIVGIGSGSSPSQLQVTFTAGTTGVFFQAGGY